MSRISIGLACALALAPNIGDAQGTGDDAGFRPLFNGKDLTGWVTPADKSLFTVKDGQIIGKSPKSLKRCEYLSTDADYRDFVLKVKVRYFGGNSGIQFRGKRDAAGIVHGPQADVGLNLWGEIFDENGPRGILDRFDKAKVRTFVKSRDWNEFVLTVRGDHVTVDFNGNRINDYTDPMFEKEGVIGMQLSPGMEIRFKDVAIKELD